MEDIYYIKKLFYAMETVSFPKIAVPYILLAFAICCTGIKEKQIRQTFYGATTLFLSVPLFYICSAYSTLAEFFLTSKDDECIQTLISLLSVIWFITVIHRDTLGRRLAVLFGLALLATIVVSLAEYVGLGDEWKCLGILFVFGIPQLLTKEQWDNLTFGGGYSGGGGSFGDSCPCGGCY